MCLSFHPFNSTIFYYYCYFACAQVIDLKFSLQFAVLSATGGIQVEEPKMRNGTYETWKLVFFFLLLLASGLTVI